MMIVIDAQSLKNASPDGEALLREVAEKIQAVESQAMARLAAKLPAKHYQNLVKRITLIKGSSQSLSRVKPSEAVTIMALSDHSPQAPDYVSIEAKNAGDCRESSLSRLKSLFGRNASKTQITKESESRSFQAKLRENRYPILAFNQKGRTAGSAYLEYWEIRLNPILLAENREQFIHEVIPHEYAHLLTFALFGRVQPHGKEWQMMMTEIMDLPAKRTHQFSTTSSQTRQYQRFEYQCSCQKHLLTSIRHNRLQAGKAEYRCRKCGEVLMQVE